MSSRNHDARPLPQRAEKLGFRVARIRRGNPTAAPGIIATISGSPFDWRNLGNAVAALIEISRLGSEPPNV